MLRLKTNWMHNHHWAKHANMPQYYKVIKQLLDHKWMHNPK